jgi:hypothetical protein
MSDARHPVVDTIIERFRAQLDAKVRDQISTAQFSDLALMIDEAIGEEVANTVERVDEVVRKLRSTAQRTELEL